MAILPIISAPDRRVKVKSTPVETVDDAGAPRLPRPAGAGEMVQDGVYQSAARVSGGRVHDHSGHLVDGDQVGVGVDDIERDVLWLGRPSGCGHGPGQRIGGHA